MTDNIQNSDSAAYNFDKIWEYIRDYRLPIIIGVGGIGIIVLSLVMLARREGKSEVTFVEHSASISAVAKIKVDIEGAVESPGVYEITTGSRIGDLLILAGGLSSGADRVWIAKYLNQAAKLSDGGKLFIPSKDNNITNTSGSTSPAGDDLLASSDNINYSGKVNINMATLAELDGLPGVGAVTAQKIVAGRPYQAIDELKTKKIVGSALFEKIKEMVVTY